MKNKPLFMVLAAAALLLFSCDFLVEPGIDRSQDPSWGNFWAQDTLTGRFYRVDADLLAEGDYCKVYVEKNTRANADTARAMAKTYDEKIYQKMIDSFGFKTTVGEETIPRNTMQLADRLGDRDGKLCILLLDIKDNFSLYGDRSYVAGYFWAENFYERSSQPYSNERDMIYVDTYPGEPGSDDSNSTLAHEMQHLMNYVTSVILRGESPMDLWIDEGLSCAAEWVCSGEHPKNRWQWFNENRTGSLINRGNNFFVWGNHAEQNSYAVLDDYATVYLFFQWLRLQSPNPENPEVYFDIITSPHSDYRSVTESMGRGSGTNAWESLLEDWLAANYINAAAGLYGYQSDPVLKTVRAKTVPAGIQNEYPGKKFPLYPGEAVYTIFKSGSTWPAASPGNADIRYAGLSETGGVSDNTAASGDALLTFNSSTGNAGNRQYGEITGYAADIDAAFEAKTSPAGTRGIVPETPLGGPFPVSAGDMLRRNKKKENNSGSVPLMFPGEISGDE